jgi:hypothetical protein
MLGEIKLKAANGKTSQRRGVTRFGLRAALSVCTAVLLCVGLLTWALDGFGPGGTTISPIDSLPAGSEDTIPGASQGIRAMNADGVSIEELQDIPALRSIFEEGEGGNFPMVLVDGRAYRLLKTPAFVDGNLIAENLGEISEYTLEPALSSGSVVSNVSAQGDAVFSVQGMNGAMVAANVGGTMRAFQRVSFAGSAVIGNESLADTLCSPGNVVSLELSDVGTVTGDAAQQLMTTLLDNASFQSASISSSGSQSLMIGLNNGLSLQLMVSGDSVSGCGTWSCPEFFEAFASAL